MSTLPTVEQFRLSNRNTVPNSSCNDRQRANILSLHARGQTVEQIARKTYPGTFPIETARLVSPEGDTTIDARLMVKWNNYLAFVQQVIDEGEQGA